jgi:hypothetical protein
MMRQLGVRVLQSLLHALQSGTSCKFIAHWRNKIWSATTTTAFTKGFMSKGFTANEAWKTYQQLIIPSWNKVPCYLIWIFSYLDSISLLYSNYIPNQREKQNQSGRCNDSKL